MKRALIIRIGIGRDEGVATAFEQRNAHANAMRRELPWHE